MSGSSIIIPSLIFFSFFWSVLSNFVVAIFVISYFAIFYYLLEARSFLRDRKGVDPNGSEEELGKVEGGETVIRIYYVSKEPIFIKEKQ